MGTEPKSDTAGTVVPVRIDHGRWHSVTSSRMIIEIKSSDTVTIYWKIAVHRKTSMVKIQKEIRLAPELVVHWS